MFELRWYTTYDKNGKDSDTVLQYRDTENDWDWHDVEYIREPSYHHGGDYDS